MSSSRGLSCDSGEREREFRPSESRRFHLVEVDDGDVPVRVRVSVDAVVDGGQVHHQQVPFAAPAVQVADRPEFYQRRRSGLGVPSQCPACVSVCPANSDVCIG